MGAHFSQFFPPRATFTGASIGSQSGKVFLITGGYSGIGFELAKILYKKGGKVYIAGRSSEEAQRAIQEIQSFFPESNGSLHFLPLSLDDLSTIAASANTFKAQECKLDVLWNNAGVSQPPLGSTSKQGFELQFATNCLGPFFFTQLLLPVLEKAVTSQNQKLTSPASGRVVWLSSQIMELSAPTGGISMHDLKNPPKDQTRNYVASKTVNYLLSCELARREGAKGIISVAINPGAASTQLFRHTPYLTYLAWPLLYGAEMAAYTELHAGLSSDITREKNGCYVIPWGRVSEAVREDLLVAAAPKESGGTGRAAEVWEYCEELTRQYANAD
jgi:NAD(P)-dependent dehydrogenase (short-subunit alcohol dehydrogenase family)